MNDKITVVMALYKPNLKWLEEELVSIEKQTFRDFSLLVWNDCPTDTYDYETFFREYLTSIPVQVYTGEKNMGSNGAFAELTKLVKTPYIAYCDQDDIWCEDKLEILLDIIDSERATLVCSDMMIIDGESRLTAPCMAAVRPRHIFYPGENALEHLLAKNFVTGCTMMMKTNIAQAALPFPDSVFHDWWLAVCAAATGRIAMAPKPLMKYRIYGVNQSAVLKGVFDKQSYFEHRIMPHKNFVKYACKVFGINEHIMKAMQWAEAREGYFLHPNFGDFKKLLLGRKYNSSTTMFELLLPFIPQIVFRKIISNVQNGNL